MDNKGQYVPPNTYTNINSSPLIQDSVPAVSWNQLIPNPSELTNLQAALKSSTQFVSCPFCKYQAMTRVEQKCSAGSTLCCVFTGGVCWLGTQLCRGKDLNCKDTDHFCTRCGNKLANYHSC